MFFGSLSLHERFKTYVQILVKFWRVWAWPKKKVVLMMIQILVWNHLDHPGFRVSMPFGIWKVLDFFFLKIPGPGKSWKLKLKVLGSPGKNP